jgi:alpha-glucosidase
MPSLLNRIVLFVVGWVLLVPAAHAQDAAMPAATDSYILEGPGALRVTVELRDGQPHYAVSYDGQPVVMPSPLGLRLQDAPDLVDGFAVVGGDTSRVDTTWQPVWGPASEIRDHYAALTLHLRETDAPRRRLDLTFRAYADGVGFRYGFPEQESLDAFAVMEELTAFRFADDAAAWWIPGDPDSYEYLYRQTPLSAVPLAHTPLTLRFHDGLHVAVHEAALVDYPAMLVAPEAPHGLRAALVPLPGTGGVKAVLETPFQTPWRTLTITPDAGGLVASPLILNLNAPCALCDGDTSWIQPGTYVGIWWSIHKGIETWAPGPHVGATTANAKRYIDFAAEHGIPYVLVEGWNEGWTDSWDDMDFTTSQPRFDLEEVAEYARERGVGYVAHMETGANVEGMEAQLDAAFDFYERLGIHAIKTGYVGAIDGHHHHDQRMVRHYQMVVEKAAAHQIMVNAHEPIKPTGLMRTWPNFMTREGVRGMEYNAWSAGNPPTHTVTLPFTRMLAGPLDYTPGIFALTWQPERVPDSPFYGAPQRRVHSTLARQLALYPVLLSGLQMAADLPEHYEGHPAFEFIAQVPATWDETRVLHGAVGKMITVARRHGAAWYVGSLTDESARTLDIPLDFLGDGAYTATIYADAPETDLRTNPTALDIQTRTVTDADTLTLHLVGGGGAAIRLVPADTD